MSTTMNTDFLLHLALESNGRYYDIKKMLSKPPRLNLRNNEETIKFLHNKGISYTTFYSREYPKELKELSQPPYVLFYKGNVELLTHPYKIFLTCDQLDASVIEKLTKYSDVLANNTVLVSRLSTLEDQIVVKLFKSKGGKVIFVSSSGIQESSDKFLFDCEFNSGKDLMVSEHLWENNSSKNSALATLRICAGLAHTLLVLSAKNVQKLLQIIDRFLENNKDVFCLMGKKDTTYSGLDYLRSIGVTAVTSIQV